MKRTAWFPCEVTPMHIGVYEISVGFIDNGGIRFSKWNGEQWSYFASDIDQWKSQYKNGPFHTTKFKWRGLAKKP